MARPTDYKPEYAEQARKLCLLGFTDIDMADFFGVNVSTITRWKKRFPEFCASIKDGKQVADANVADSLYKRAIGIEYKEKKLKDDGQKTIQEVTVKYIPPDTGAAAFWLKNRQPDMWRDRRQTEVTGADGGPIETLALTRDEYLQARREMMEDDDC